MLAIVEPGSLPWWFAIGFFLVGVVGVVLLCVFGLRQQRKKEDTFRYLKGKGDG